MTATEMHTAGRVFAAGAGDPSGMRSVLYGGQAPGNSTPRSDTWVNEPDGTWKPMCGTQTTGATAVCGPGGREGLGMATAPRGVILYGGFPGDIGGGSGQPPYGDTWRWNGATWSNVCPLATCGPGARGLMAMSGNGTSAVMFGGIGESGPLSDTWVFDGTQWTQACGQTGSPCGPTALAGAAMAWDGHHFVLFGGVDLSTDGTPTDDTWIFSGAQWTKVCGTSMHKPCGPSARGLSAFAFANDPDAAARGAILAEGGNIFTNDNQQLSRDAWFFNDATWTKLDPPWNGTPVHWVNGSPPAGADPLLGVLASKPALCEVVYLGTSITTAGNPPVATEGTWFAGRDLWDRTATDCHPKPADPGGGGLEPTITPGTTPPTTAAPAPARATLAATGSRAVATQTLVALLLIALGAALIAIDAPRHPGTRRR